MLILFDHSTPRGVGRVLTAHTVITAYAKGWDRLTNGDLIKAAEDTGVDLLLTADRRIRYQQNLTNRRIAIVVLTARLDGLRCVCISIELPPRWRQPFPEATARLKFPSHKHA
jgi:hypothetical protein